MLKKIYFPILLIAGLTVITSLVIFSFLGVKKAETGLSDNVSGWAWSDNIGWISFNNTTDGSANNYGVDISDTGIFSGYAWSDNIGWITFNRTDTGAPPGPPDYGTYLAQVDLDSGQVSGWARALSYGDGWDGWIKLRDTNYGVLIDNNPASPTYQQFSGWAWGDMVMGWISFNCLNQAECGTSDYKVRTSFAFNRPPEKPLLPPEYPGGESWNNCSIQELSIPTFHWTYLDQDEDPQAAYQIKIFGETTLDETISCIVSPCESYTPSNTWIDNNLNWAGTYNWQVRVKDNQGNWSAWSDSNPFTVPIHAYPWVNFNWTPPLPKIEEVIHFTDQTTFYGGATGTSWSWDFGDSGTSPVQSPTHSYLSPGSYTVKLTACDNTPVSNEGPYCCGAPQSPNAQKDVTVTLPLPEWMEVSPF